MRASELSKEVDRHRVSALYSSYHLQLHSLETPLLRKEINRHKSNYFPKEIKGFLMYVDMTHRRERKRTNENTRANDANGVANITGVDSQPGFARHEAELRESA
jgi:hypothetical protein